MERVRVVRIGGIALIVLLACLQPAVERIVVARGIGLRVQLLLGLILVSLAVLLVGLTLICLILIRAILIGLSLMNIRLGHGRLGRIAMQRMNRADGDGIVRLRRGCGLHVGASHP